MVSPPVIHNFNELVEPHLNGARVITYKSRFLTKPGENYGSTMLAITANIQRPSGDIEELELVGKLPPMSELYWKFFQPEKTFIAENNIYTELAPALRKFQEEQNVNVDALIDVFPKCYGARVSLEKNSKQVDKNAALILENLVTCGYKTGERSEGFDYTHTVVILKSLAKFHALPIALRVLKPKIFKEKCIDCIQKFNMNSSIDKEVRDDMFETSLNDMRKIPEIGEDMIKKMPEIFSINDKFMADLTRNCDGLFDTVVHHDFWVNNMLILQDSNGEPCKIKIVDFQLVQLDSLVHDVIFFLFSSVKSEILRENYENFLRIYYDYFLGSLKETGCPTNEYSHEKFLEEIKRWGSVQISHVLIMLKVLFLKKEVAPADFNEMDPKMFSDENCYGQKYYDKLRDTMLMFRKLGFI